MSVTKLKPVRTPRVMDEWTEQNALACEQSKQIAQNAIERSKQLVEQSREIKARLETRLEKGKKPKAARIKRPHR
jgi:hypothetical protein